MDRFDGDDVPTTTDDTAESPTSRSHAEQEHPEQDAHGGSMAPGLVDDTGEPVEDAPEGDATR